MLKKTMWLVVLIVPTTFLLADRHVCTILSDPSEREALGSFIDHVLRQVPSEKFYTFLERKTKDISFNDDAELYAFLQQDIHSIKSSFPLIPVIKALRFQQELLTNQARSLLGNNQTFNGCIEIGTPGTYMAPLSDCITGSTYALYEKQALSDYVQSFALKPSNNFLAFNTFIPLNNYEPIDAKSVPSQSVDLFKKIIT